MDLRNSIFVFAISLIVCCYGEITVNYRGGTVFEAGTNASLSCSFEPIPDDLSSVTVGWYKVGKDLTMTPRKIALSSVGEGNSFIYGNAPQELADRFNLSSEGFEEGNADATIESIRIADEGYYSCDVEDTANRLQKRLNFELQVYQIPTVTIRNVLTKIDLRPVPEEPATDSIDGGNGNNVNGTEIADTTNEDEALDTENESEENGENESEDDTGNAETTGAETPMEEDNNVKRQASNDPDGGAKVIATCAVDNVYPTPRITFVSSKGSVWDGELVRTIENPDGSYNVTANLTIKPVPDLDEATLQCVAYITDSNIGTESRMSEMIEVKYETSSVTVAFTPTATPKEGDAIEISCVANGNPVPTLTLTTPDGSSVDVSERPYSIASITPMSAGNYHCSAGEISKEEYLTVFYMETPTITGPALDDVKQGSNVELRCESNANVAVKYNWFKDGAKLATGAVLELSNLQQSNTGSYTCQAVSLAGNKEAQHSLDVLLQCNPKISYQVTSSKITPDNHHVQVTCLATGKPSCDMEITLSAYDDTDRVVSDNKIQVVIEDMEQQDTDFQVTCTAKNFIKTEKVNSTVSDVCCTSPNTGSTSPGVIIIVVVIAVLFVVGVAVACYVMRNKRQSKKANISNEKNEDVEAEKLTQPTEENHP